MYNNKNIDDIKNARIFVVTEKFNIPLLVKFLKSNEDLGLKIVAFDNLISYFLREAKIEHFNLNELISQEQKEKIIIDATDETVSQNNIFLAKYYKSKKYKDMAIFFDAVKMNILDDIMILNHQSDVFEIFIDNVSPKKVYLIDNESITLNILKNVLLRHKIPSEDIKTTRLYSLKKIIISELPFCGKEKRFRNKVFNVFDKVNIIRNMRYLIHNKRVYEKYSVKKDTIVISTISFWSDIKEFSELIISLNKIYNVVVVMNPKLYDEDYEFLKKNDIDYIYLPVFFTRVREIINKIFKTEKEDKNKEDRRKQHQNQHQLKTIEEIFAECLFSRDKDQNKIFIDHFDILGKYKSHLNHVRTFDWIYRKLKPTICLCISEYDDVTRASIYAANKRKIKTIGISNTIVQTQNEAITKNIEELNKKKSKEAQTKKLSILIHPERVFVSGNKILQSINRFNTMDLGREKVDIVGSIRINRLYQERESLLKSKDKIKSKLLNEWGLPPESRILLFTGNQHDYSFDYVNILSQILDEIIEKQGCKNVFLVVKPHPLEYNFLYKHTNQYKHHKNILFKKDIDLYESIISSDAVITSYSFTNIEALLLGKKVILIDLKKYPFPLFSVEHRNLYRVNDVTSLRDVLIRLIERKDKIIDDKETLDEYFKTDSRPIKEIIDIIKTELKR